MEVVPLPQPALFLLDDQYALARQHEEALLRRLGVVERVRVARPEDAEVDAHVLERVLPRLDWIARAALLRVANRQRVFEVEHEPALGSDVAAVRRDGGARLPHLGPAGGLGLERLASGPVRSYRREDVDHDRADLARGGRVRRARRDPPDPARPERSRLLTDPEVHRALDHHSE